MSPVVKWPMTSRDPERSRSWPRYLWRLISQIQNEVSDKWLVPQSLKFFWELLERDFSQAGVDALALPNQQHQGTFSFDVLLYIAFIIFMSSVHLTRYTIKANYLLVSAPAVLFSLELTVISQAAR